MSKEARKFNTFQQITELLDDGVFNVGQMINGELRFKLLTKKGFIDQFELGEIAQYTRAEMLVLIANSELKIGKQYYITDAVGGGTLLLTTAIDTNVLATQAIDNSGNIFYYDINTDAGAWGVYIQQIKAQPVGPPAYEEGLIWYDEESRTISYYDDISGTSTQIAQENHVRARNSTGSQINDGQVVYISGATGSNPNITLAQANTASTSRVIGMVTHNIANNTIGKVTTFGIVNDIDTSAFTDGALLYLSSSVAGGLTMTRPSAPNYAVLVGVCLRAHSTQGKILVNPDQRGLGFGAANQLLGINAGATEQEYKTLSGNTNQVTVTHSVNGITLSLPQSIATTSSPTFAGLTLTNALTASNGGTGQSSYTIGDLLFASGATTLSKLADVATGNALISGGVGTAPSWGKIGLTTHVSGTLPIANGGTNNTGTPTNGQVLIGNGTTYVLAGITGTANQVTVTNGAGTITLSLPQSIATTSTPQFARVGLGGASATGSIIAISGSLTGAATSYNLALNSSVQSDVTNAFGIDSVSNTQATSFTLSNYTHFRSAQGTFGLGSTVTTQTGFFANSSLIGATNNYGFRGAIPSGANRWNIYMDGTAQNHIQGNLLLGSTTATAGAEKLQVTGNASVSGNLLIGNAVQASVATPSTHKVTMVIGGVTYYLLATNV